MLLQNAQCNIDYHNNGSLYSILTTTLTIATYAPIISVHLFQL